MTVDGMAASGAAQPAAPRPSTPQQQRVDLSLSAAVHTLWQRGAAEQANAQLQSALRSSLARIVWRASLGQTLKGVITAGGARSVQYVAAKLAKSAARRP